MVTLLFVSWVQLRWDGRGTIMSLVLVIRTKCAPRAIECVDTSIGIYQGDRAR